MSQAYADYIELFENQNRERMIMSLDIQQFARKPFYVEAVKVTEENLQEVATWVGGRIKKTNRKGDGLEPYVKVNVKRPLHDRQKQAFVGDWVLRYETLHGTRTVVTFKVYTNDAFLRNFISVDEHILPMGVEAAKAMDAGLSDDLVELRTVNEPAE